MQKLKALARLGVCTGASEASLFADAICKKISCAGLFVLFLSACTYVYTSLCENAILNKQINTSNI